MLRETIAIVRKDLLELQLSQIAGMKIYKRLALCKTTKEAKGVAVRKDLS